MSLGSNTDRVRSRGRVGAIVALSLAASLLVVPATDEGPFAALGPTPAAAASTPAGPVSSSSYSPAASFTDLAYSVQFLQRIFHPTGTPHRWSPRATNGLSWFGEVIADERSENLELSFAVEGQHDPSGYQFCQKPSICDDVEVAVTPAGLLYLLRQRSPNLESFLADFPTRIVELSATDADTPLKVYREVLVEPPTSATGCEDYGEDNPDAYACLFLRELIPEGIGGSSNEATLRAGLPGLVQPAANYNLVFAEEFDGTPPAADAAGCRDGLSTLNNDVWNYKDPCESAFRDSRGDSCGNVADGKLEMGLAGTCSGFLADTAGKLHAKYGYFEMKYTFNAPAWARYHNYNFILFARGETLRFLLDRYEVEIDDWEDFLTNMDIEIDLIEMDVNRKAHISHQYANYHYRIANENITPTWMSRWYAFCPYEQWSKEWSIISNPDLPCRPNDTFTVTVAVEWTPRGYRNFIKVDEFHDEMIVAPKANIHVNLRPVEGDRLLPGKHRTLSGAAKDRYFEYVDPDDPDTLLEQGGVSHVPLPLNVNAWGYLDSRWHTYVRTWMKIDHIRVWQPTDHYSNMEPVYQ